MGFGLAAAAAISVAGSMMQGAAAKKAAKIDEKAAEARKDAEIKAARLEGAFARDNADFTRENAMIIRSKAAQDAAQADRQARLRLGSIRAAAGASGGRLNIGSIQDILSDVAAQSELEKQTILHQSELAVRDELQRVKGFELQEQLAGIRIEAAEKGAELASRAASQAGTLGVAKALLGGAGTIFSFFGGAGGGGGGGGQ